MQKTLLLIVDDWEALEVYETRLSPHFRILTAAFGSEGLRVAQEQRPELIFIDLTMEDMHASEACERLRAMPETRAIPLILILNENEKAVEKAGVFPLPGDRLVRRPYRLEELISESGSPAETNPV